MIARWTVHSLPKAGAAEGENEDAAAGPVARDGAVRFAIADGATETAFARVWAQRLAHAAAEAPLEVAIGQARTASAERARAPRGAAAWYLEQKLAEGAHAGVLALEIRRDGTWNAAAVGDCLLMHLRGGQLLKAWPVEDVSAFGHRPVLVASLPEVPVPDVERAEGHWRSGDVMLLATDALGAFLLGGDPATAIDLSEEEFAAFVRRARHRGMHNDDVTLIDIELR